MTFCSTHFKLSDIYWLKFEMEVNIVKLEKDEEERPYTYTCPIKDEKDKPSINMWCISNVTQVLENQTTEMDVVVKLQDDEEEHPCTYMCPVNDEGDKPSANLWCVNTQVQGNLSSEINTPNQTFITMKKVGTQDTRLLQPPNSIRSLLQNPFQNRTLVKKLQVKELGPDQPDIKIRQQASEKGKTYMRGFSSNWYSRKAWLAGCSSANAVFCFPCLLFKTAGTDTTWTVTGVGT